MVWLISFNPLETEIYTKKKENKNLLDTMNLYFYRYLFGIILQHAV